jgi:putative RecB family exonuclease
VTTVTRVSAEQLLLDAMPGPLFACTPSRLATFECPRRYRFTYLDRPAPPRGAPWAHNTVGAGVHLALARWWSLPAAHRTPDEGAALLERHWSGLGFRDAAQSLRGSVVAGRWVRDYLATHVRAVRTEPVGVERTVAATTGLLAVSGRVDRIDARGDELVVVDYKSGRHVPTDDDARRSPALALYALGVARTLRRPCRRVELHHLPTGTVAAAEHSPDALAGHVTRAEETARAVRVAAAARAAGTDADTAYPAVTSPGCSWCDFRGACPEGRAASPERAPWDGLPAEIADPATGAATTGDAADAGADAGTQR